MFKQVMPGRTFRVARKTVLISLWNDQRNTDPALDVFPL